MASRPVGENRYFPKVKEAREALQEKAKELYERYDKAILAAMEKGEFETAIKAMQWLMEHFPKGDDGQSIIDTSIDQKKVSEKSGGPTINVGIALGGVNAKKALPAVEVIEAETHE